MGMKLVYKNSFGKVTMTGNSNGVLRICSVEGLGPIVYDYNTAVFSGYDGQETVSRRALPRYITLSLESNMSNTEVNLDEILNVFQFSGVLYIIGEEKKRRIRCNQTYIPEIKSVIRGEIAAFTVQLVCDNPFFEDVEDTIIPLYERRKKLSTPFSLPSAFGEIVLGGSIEVKGIENVEPVITIHYPNALTGVEFVVVKNLRTVKQIQLDYAPKNKDTVVIDVKNRKVTSALGGNIINYLSADTFLGDFVFVPGINTVEVLVGDVPAEFVIECKYNNLYREAEIV